MKNIRIIRINNGKREILEDLVTEEIPLRLLTGDKTFTVLVCSPLDLEDLVMGYLFTSGLIDHKKDVIRITIDPVICTAYIDWAVEPENTIGKSINQTNQTNRTIESDLRFDSVQVGRWLSDFKKRSSVFKKTGGVHGAAIADDDGIVLFRGDISRYNAIDKVVGWFLTEGLTFDDKVIIMSGRVSSNILAKTLRCGIPSVISLGAPTDRSVSIARQAKITLIGFAREGRMNIYSGDERFYTD